MSTFKVDPITVIIAAALFGLSFVAVKDGGVSNWAEVKKVDCSVVDTDVPGGRICE